MQCDWENHEHLRCLRDVYCVMTNHNKDQDTYWIGHKTTNLINVLTCDLVFPRLIGFSLSRQYIPEIFLVFMFSRFDCKGHKNKRIQMNRSQHNKGTNESILGNDSLVHLMCSVPWSKSSQHWSWLRSSKNTCNPAFNYSTCNMIIL